MDIKRSIFSYLAINVAIILVLISAYSFIAFTIPANAISLEKDTFYVSENGNDSNDGTIDAPWKTIQKAADTLNNGETVYVRGEHIQSLFTLQTLVLKRKDLSLSKHFQENNQC